MKLLRLASCFLIIFNFFIPTKCISQLHDEDSSLYHASINNTVAFYHQVLSPEGKLYDGIEYIPYDYQITRGSPYFQSTKYSSGYVVYNNILYENIPLMYDLVKSKVVLNSYYKIFSIELNNEKITQFGILGHTFIRISKDSSANGLIKTGFYDLLYTGKLSLLKKQNKNIQEEYNGSLIEKYILDGTEFYIRKDAKFFSANTKKSVLKILADRKKDIKQYIRKNKLNIRKDKDQSLVKIVAYYDEITK